MKQNMHFYAVMALLATAATLSSCQQEETMMGHTPADESSAQESLVGTRSDVYPLCTIVTDTLGQVKSKLAAYSEEMWIPVAAIDKISIEGPINQTDINYLKSLSYVDSLSLEKALFHNASGTQDNTLPKSCFARFKSEAAVVLPDHITTMGPLCFVRSNIRAIYMDKVQVLQETEEKIDVGSYNSDIDFDSPDNITQDYAGGQFARCPKLKEVKLSGNISFIPTYMFYLCSALEKIDFPSSLTEIRRGAYACSGLKEVIMNDKLIYLRDESFRNCSSLERVNVNKKLYSIGYRAFGDCSKLKSFTIPESVKELGVCVFYNDENLTEVIWPRMLSTIPKSTFYGCTRLKFTIPDYTTSIGDYAFGYCKAITEMTMPPSVKSFGNYIFEYSGLRSLVKGMDWIPDGFYYGCAGFRDLIIPDSIRDVQVSAFGRCPNLTSVTIRGGVFGTSVFNDCDALKEVTIEQCGDIGSSAFYNCDALEKVTIEQCGSIGSYAFFNSDALSKVTIEQCGSIGEEVFISCDALKEVTIKQCGSIGSKAFTCCYALKEVTIEQCENIGSRAFEDCFALKEVTIKQCGSIGSNAFRNCYALKEVTLEQCSDIGSSAFEYCSSLKHLTIPSTVESVGSYILTGCGNVRYVDWLSTHANVPFLGGSNPNMLLFIPAGVSSDSRNKNLVCDGMASRLELWQNLFYTPRSFTAQKVVFTIDYGSDRWKNTSTGTGVAARWNTIAVPFDVSSITSSTKGALAPFGSDAVNSGKAKPFWLCELTAEGFKDATSIEANKPYIIAMPNSPNYLDEYNIQDVVTFEGNNVTIPLSSEVQPSSPTGPAGWALTPIYQESSDASLMAINWSSFTDSRNVWHPVGNCFRQNVRTANAFEAVITTPAAVSVAKQKGYISLGGATTRSTRPLGHIPQREDMPMP